MVSSQPSMSSTRPKFVRKVEGKLKGASGSGEFTDEIRAAVEAENDRGGSDNGIVVSECEANCEADRVIHLNCTPPSTGFEHLAVVLHNNHTDEAKGHFFCGKSAREIVLDLPGMHRLER